MKIVRLLRLAGILEGTAFLVLLLVAMPLKYVYGYPMAVRIAGLLHGGLFLWFLWALLGAHVERGWPVRTSLGLLGAALMPFGFVAVDSRLRRELVAAEDDARAGT